MGTEEFKREQPSHLNLLIKDKQELTTKSGETVSIWHLQLPDDELLSDWAKYFREHYCLDDEIDELRNGTGLSRRDYLLQLILPDQKVAPGPGIRAGDFAEVLVADYLEFSLGYWVPREKYAWKAVRNESIKGVDTLGFHLPNIDDPKKTDTLIAFEVKAKLSGKKYEENLQDAINHSAQDYLRRAETLNATKRRLLTHGQRDRALVVERFQNISDRPYNYRSGAAAVLTDAVYDLESIAVTTNSENHPDSGQLDLIVIHGQDLMAFVHALYERSADEA